MSGARGVERACKDCGVLVEHAGGKGRWPERCPEHRAARDLETHKLAKRDRRSAVERKCLDCGTGLQRVSQKWPARCPACQLARTNELRRQWKADRRPTHIATCPDCGGQRQVTRSSHLEARCHPCGQRRANQQTADRARANPERRRSAEKRWRTNNPDKVLNKNHARRVAATGAESEEILTTVLVERDGTQCSLCPAEIDLDLKWPHPGSRSIDHVTPIAQGGSHTYRNVALAHLVCNISKNVTEAPQTRYSDLLVTSGS